MMVCQQDARTHSHTAARDRDRRRGLSTLSCIYCCRHKRGTGVDHYPTGSLFPLCSPAMRDSYWTVPSSIIRWMAKGKYIRTSLYIHILQVSLPYNSEMVNWSERLWGENPLIYVYSLQIISHRSLEGAGCRYLGFAILFRLPSGTACVIKIID